MIMTKETPLHEQYNISESDLNFIHEYIAGNFNGRKAWQKLHPDSKGTTATTEASAALRKPNIRAAYHAELRHHYEVIGMTSQGVLKELVNIATSDITDFVSEENGELELKPLNNIKLNSKSIKEIIITPTSVRLEEDDDGKPVYRETKKVNLKMHDKMRALQMIGDAFGTFKDESDNEGDELVIIRRTVKSKDDIGK